MPNSKSCKNKENIKKLHKRTSGNYILGEAVPVRTVLEKYEYLNKSVLANAIQKRTLVASSCAVFKEWIKNFELST